MVRNLTGPLWLVLLLAALVPVGSAQTIRPEHFAPFSASFLDSALAADSLFVNGNADSSLTLIRTLKPQAAAHPPALARLLFLEGQVLIRQRRGADAERSYLEAIRLSRAAGDTTTLMPVLGYYGRALGFVGRSEEAMACFQEQLALAVITGNRRSEGWARISVAYRRLIAGTPRDALPDYRKALNLFNELEDRRGLSTTLVGLGRTFSGLDEIDSARVCFQRVWLMAREGGLAEQEAHAVNNLGVLEYDLGSRAVAAQYFERAYELHKESGNLRATITPAKNIAMIRVVHGRYEEGAAILNDALRTCEQSNFKSLKGLVLGGLAHVRLEQGRHRAAARHCREILDLGDAVPAHNRLEALFRLPRAVSEMDSLEAAIRILEDGLVEASSNPRWNSLFQLRLSRLLLEAGDPEGALDHALRAMETKRVLRSGSPAPELFITRSYLAQGKSEEAYAWFHRAVDALGRAQESDELELREAGYSGVWGLVDAGHAILDYPPETPRHEREERLFDVLQRFKAEALLERMVEPRRAGDLVTEEESASVTLAKLQELLEPNELLCDFFVSKNETFLFAVSRDSCRLTSLPGINSNLPEEVDLYCGLLADRGRQSTGDQIQKMQLSLGRALFADIADLVKDARRIVVVPDAFFSSIPFGTLRIPGESEPLLVTREIEQLPSATILELCRTAAAAPSRAEGKILALAWGEGPGGRLAGAEEEVRYLEGRFAEVDLVGLEGGTLSKDVLGDHEVLHIAAHAEINDESPWHSGILLGRVGAAPADGELGSPVIRGSTTGALTLSPEDSLTIAQEIPPDPYLRAGEIATLDLPARLAVLAGCESALGRVTLGEGVLGLTAAFLVAGVPSVVATLWAVDDRVTADLMKRFYRGLEKGETVSSSLRHAQLQIRSRTETAHPFYWAGFIVVGEGSTTIDLERKPTEPRRQFLFVLAAILLLMLLVRVSKLR